MDLQSSSYVSVQVVWIGLIMFMMKGRVSFMIVFVSFGSLLTGCFRYLFYDDCQVWGSRRSHRKGSNVLFFCKGFKFGLSIGFYTMLYQLCGNEAFLEFKEELLVHNELQH